MAALGPRGGGSHSPSVTPSSANSIYEFAVAVANVTRSRAWRSPIASLHSAITPSAMRPVVEPTRSPRDMTVPGAGRSALVVCHSLARRPTC